MTVPGITTTSFNESKEENEMKKLRDMIEKIYEGKIPKGMTLADANMLIYVYKMLAWKKEAYFIQDAIVRPLTDCGITVKPYGVGWRAHR